MTEERPKLSLTEEPPEPNLAEERPKLKPMSGATGNRVLLHLAWTCSVIGIVALALEVATERRLSNAAGIPFFITTPLGVGALILTIRVLMLEAKRAAFPVVMALIYWGLYLAYI